MTDIQLLIIGLVSGIIAWGIIIIVRNQKDETHVLLRDKVKKREMSYLKGKDIKQKGDCLTYLFIKKIETMISGASWIKVDGYEVDHITIPVKVWTERKPEGFEKW